MSIIFYRLGVESRKLADEYDVKKNSAIENGDAQLAKGFGEISDFHRAKSRSYFRMGATRDANDQG